MVSNAACRKMQSVHRMHDFGVPDLSRCISLGLGALVAGIWSTPALAHVKWFVPFESAAAPAEIGQVLTGPMVITFLLCLAGVYAFFLVDRYLYRMQLFPRLDQRLHTFDDFSIGIMAVSTGVFFLSLFGWSLITGGSFFLTPELATDHPIVPYLHLLFGLAAFIRWTRRLAGIGILVLYGWAMAEYGWYHMIDYLLFPGIAYFLLVSGSRHRRWITSGFVVLFASVGLSLVWGAVEKFAYPDRFFTLFEARPDILMGFDRSIYLMLAAYVEFTITFVLLSAASAMGRLVALAFQTIFILGIVMFGLIDAIGHLLILATLFVLIVRGPTAAREMLVLRDKSIWTEAYFMSGLYVFALVMIFILYYGLHSIAYAG
jgi:hypothetical protein